jgi:predicted secreted protein
LKSKGAVFERPAAGLGAPHPPNPREEFSMSNQIGLIKDSIGDRRAGKLVFLSHCMLNQNACVRGLASQPAVIREIVDLALDNDVAIYQMPCPEVSYLGSMRWGMVKRMYGNPMFRRHCRRIAQQVCDQIQTYRDNGHEVKGVVMRDGSPTCGLKCAAVEADEGQVWGGMVWHASPCSASPKPRGGPEELKAELAGGWGCAPLSLPEVPEAGSIPDALAEIGKVFEGAP